MSGTGGNGTCCAHLRVEFWPIENEDGTKTERWICSDLCGQEFVRKSDLTTDPTRPTGNTPSRHRYVPRSDSRCAVVGCCDVYNIDGSHDEYGELGTQPMSRGDGTYESTNSWHQGRTEGDSDGA